MTLDWKMHRNDETVKGHFLCVAARANSHEGFYVFVTAFPCPVRYPVRGRAIILCVAARAILHGGFFVFVTAFPCPVSVAGWDKAYFFTLPL